MKTLITVFGIVGLLALGLTGCQSTYVTSAKIYLQQNDLKNAQEQLEQGLKTNPNDAQAHYLLGQVYSKQKKFPEMIAEFDAAMALSDKFTADIEKMKAKHSRELYNSGVENFNAGNHEKAIKQLEMATVVDPDDQEGWALLGKAYIRSEMVEEAVDALEKAAELDPTYEKVDDRTLLMEIYYNEDRVQEALNLAMEIIRQDPKNREAIKVAAFCYNQQGQTEKAFEYYQEIMRDNPDDPDLIFNYGLLFEAMEQYEEAAAQFERTYQLNPQDEIAYKKCGLIHLEMLKNNQKAVECYRLALENIPDSPDFMNNLGIALIRAGQDADDQALIDEGTEHIKQAAELRQTNP
jgi:tetratricopeptide (TPR) repeat protein